MNERLNVSATSGPVAAVSSQRGTPGRVKTPAGPRPAAARTAGQIDGDFSALPVHGAPPATVPRSAPGRGCRPGPERARRFQADSPQGGGPADAAHPAAADRSGPGGPADAGAQPPGSAQPPSLFPPPHPAPRSSGPACPRRRRRCRPASGWIRTSPRRRTRCSSWFRRSSSRSFRQAPSPSRRSARPARRRQPASRASTSSPCRSPTGAERPALGPSAPRWSRASPLGRRRRSLFRVSLSPAPHAKTVLNLRGIGRPEPQRRCSGRHP